MKLQITGYTPQEFVKRMKEKESEGWTLIKTWKQDFFFRACDLNGQGRAKHKGYEQKKRYYAVFERN